VWFSPFAVVAVLSVSRLANGEEQPADAGLSLATSSAESWTQTFDRLWTEREDSKILQQAYQLTKAQLAQNSRDFEANWRMAAILLWQADGMGDGTQEKATYSKRGWEWAERAASIKPNDIHAEYHAGVGIGLYSEGVGVITALREGLEGKFRAHVQAAITLDRHYLNGAPQVLWGRYFFKLPWPKRDVDESIRVLRTCLKEHPTNLRAKLYLADSLYHEDVKGEALKLIDEIASAPLGTDPAEDRRIKKRAEVWKKDHQK
jgi:hypothetical protein